MGPSAGGAWPLLGAYPVRVTGRQSEAGFSLLELMVVVVIIALLSALAIPTMLQAARERRVQQAAISVLDAFRNARGRAMYRGRAQMLVVQPSGGALRIELYEGTSNVCRNGRFGNLSGTLNVNSLADVLDLNDAVYTRDDLVAEITRPGGTSYLRVCFTPLGNTFFGTTVYTGANDAWSNDYNLVGVGGAFQIDLYQFRSGQVAGVRRRVLIPIGGTPRMRT